MEEEPKQASKNVTDVEMSRGEREEVNIGDFKTFRDLFVYDEQGNKIRFGDIYKRQKTIIIFVRHFLCFICKEYMEDLAIIPLEYLQEAEVRLVVIGPSPFKFIKPFKKETGFQYTFYCDPDREVYKAFGLKEAVKSGPLSYSKHVKSNAVSGIVKSTWKAMKVQEYQGDVNQQGGAFVFGPGEVIHFSHIDKQSTDHSSINDILDAAGVQQVSFELDPRVQRL